MRKALLTLAASLVATEAFAHPSLFPHHHPHGPSALLGLDTILLIALVGVLGWLVWRNLKRN
jgi:hydrogenase/urease accessory protein HupE